MTTTFVLWHPVFDKGGMNCHFDVIPYDFVRLNKGTQSLIEQFLKDLTIRSKPVRWNISSFRSPYYASAYVPDWRSKYVLGWHVEVELADSGELGQPRSFNSYSSEALDETSMDKTWQAQEENWQPTQCSGVVIADFTNEEWQKAQYLLAEYPVFVGSKIQSHQLGPHLTHIRLEMGPRKFPEDTEHINELVSTCEKLAFSVNWATTLKKSEQLKRMYLTDAQREEIKRLFGYSA